MPIFCWQSILKDQSWSTKLGKKLLRSGVPSNCPLEGTKNKNKDECWWEERAELQCSKSNWKLSGHSTLVALVFLVSALSSTRLQRPPRKKQFTPARKGLIWRHTKESNRVSRFEWNFYQQPQCKCLEDWFSHQPQYFFKWQNVPRFPTRIGELWIFLSKELLIRPARIEDAWLYDPQNKVSSTNYAYANNSHRGTTSRR